MDPYDILGISENATQEEIKKAYLREAMRWHPDRCDNSSEARERFHRAAEAYKFLTQKYTRNGSEYSSKQSSAWNNYRHSKSDNTTGSQRSSAESEDGFADTVFWEEMLDFAIKLAQSGLREREISINLIQNGCPDRIAAVIADKAFNIHAHYASTPGMKSKAGKDNSTFREERLETDLQRAFLGRRNIIWSPRDTIEYYLMVFRDFGQAENSKFPFKIHTNKLLMRILSFSILFFVVIFLAIKIYPGDSQYKLLPDLVLLQLPLGILSLMFIWTIYRKLWVFTFIFWLIFLVSIVYFNSSIAQALNSDYASILTIAAICYSPFVFIALFGNYFYYRKAQKTISSADQLFEEHQDKYIWIHSRSGTSSTAAFLFIAIYFSSLIYFVPGDGGYLNSISSNFPDMGFVKDDSADRKARLRLQNAARYFENAESHLDSTPPDYYNASKAYRLAADNGSLLAAYNLGYMYYTGEGVTQSDLLALEFFELAVRAPLAFQPHSLELTTEYLAESYNNLGIMYQGGYGTKSNTGMAAEMFKKGKKFGSKNAELNLASVYIHGSNVERGHLASPTYE